MMQVSQRFEIEKKFSLAIFLLSLRCILILLIAQTGVIIQDIWNCRLGEIKGFLERYMIIPCQRGKLVIIKLKEWQ